MELAARDQVKATAKPRLEMPQDVSVGMEPRKGKVTEKDLSSGDVPTYKPH